MVKSTLKKDFRGKTLDEKVMKDGLQAASQLNGLEPYYLVGGIATQTYLPSSCRRPTADVDFSLARSLSYSDFKEMILPVKEWLGDHNYETETKKGSRACILYALSEEGEGLVLEFARRSPNNFQSRRHMLEREFENSKKKIVEERDSTCTVSSTEDIIIPKLVRLINCLGRNPDFKKYVPKEVQNLNERNIRSSLNYINNIREEVNFNPGDVELSQKLKFKSDLYDIRLLSELGGINETYLSKVSSEWNDLHKNPGIRERVCSTTLPEFSFQQL